MDIIKLHAIYKTFFSALFKKGNRINGCTLDKRSVSITAFMLSRQGAENKRETVATTFDDGTG